ncbi:MAG: hypothetical protein IJP66_09545, partial [Kiritimatiellae bacterium]|nr:hypothetical protein [Kiritimatiellia bacterium]
MACRFAGAPDLPSFWSNVLAARPSFSELPDPSASRYLAEDIDSLRHIPTLRAALLGDLWRTASDPKDMSEVNPVLALAADLAAAALRDAAAPHPGAANPAPERIGAYIGHSPGFGPAEATWFQSGLAIDLAMELVRRCFPHGSPEDFVALKESMDAALPAFNSRGARNLLPQALPSHVAERCNIAGPVSCLDAGDASVTLSIQNACDALLAGRIDTALAGGVQGPVSPQLMMPFARMGALSKNGEPRPFSKDADGTLLGEGGGFLVLRRHADAVRDGDRIYAIVKAAATASAGNSRRLETGYAGALRAVWPQDDPDLGTIDLLEGNGNGIPAIDKAEIKSFCSILGDLRLKRDSIAQGSSKALFGDCLAAAGAAGAIKAALALRNRVIPPGLPPQDAARAIDLDGTPN